MMIDHQSWSTTQEYEKKHWLKNGKRYLSDDVKMKLRLKAEQNEKWVSQFIELEENSRIMEIGGAAEPIIDFFNKGMLVSLDPLNNFYSVQFQSLFNPKVRRIQGTAEDIPFDSRFFDLIIMYNVLDHTQDPSNVISETSRCIRNQGVLAFSVDTFPIYWVWGRRLFPLLGGHDHLLHPHSFSMGKVFRLLRREGFDILEAKLDLFIPERQINHAVGPIRRKTYSLLNYRRQRIVIMAKKAD
jgi:SAM-dependent methyltransferase